MTLSQGERIARLETQLENVEDKLDKASKKLDQIHEVFLQAKGAKWIIVFGATVAGFLASYVPNLIAYLSGLPR